MGESGWLSGISGEEQATTSSAKERVGDKENGTEAGRKELMATSAGMAKVAMTTKAGDDRERPKREDDDDDGDGRAAVPPARRAKERLAQGRWGCRRRALMRGGSDYRDGRSRSPESGRR